MVAPLTATVLAAAAGRARRHRQRGQQRGRPGRLAARGRGAAGRGRPRRRRSTPTRWPSTRRTARRLIICAVLLALGGLLSWVTIRKARRSTDVGGRLPEVRITKRVAPCATKPRDADAGPAAGERALRGAAHRLDRGQGARARAARRDGHGHRVAEQGAGGHPRPRRAADRARLHRRTAPRGADGRATAPSSRRSATG